MLLLSLGPPPPRPTPRGVGMSVCYLGVCVLWEPRVAHSSDLSGLFSGKMFFFFVFLSAVVIAFEMTDPPSSG